MASPHILSHHMRSSLTFTFVTDFNDNFSLPLLTYMTIIRTVDSLSPFCSK